MSTSLKVFDINILLEGASLIYTLGQDRSTLVLHEVLSRLDRKKMDILKKLFWIYKKAHRRGRPRKDA